MRARDVIGRRIIEVRQARHATRQSGDGREVEAQWVVDGFVLDNGAVLHVLAIETDTEPMVIAWVAAKHNST